ncbi:hypothetical protein F2Q68_00027490 [Brassica cretica]|nr:hypothetical protein F2Q68_00027490 [Brassica cretica]
MGTRFTKDGKIVGVDPDNDLAVLKIETEGRELNSVALGTSSDLCVGQSCLACLMSLKLWRIISSLMTSLQKLTEERYVIAGWAHKNNVVPPVMFVIVSAPSEKKDF